MSTIDSNHNVHSSATGRFENKVGTRPSGGLGLLERSLGKDPYPFRVEVIDRGDADHVAARDGERLASPAWASSWDPATERVVFDPHPGYDVEPMTSEEVSQARESALACALWTSTDESGEPLDAEFAFDDFSPEAQQAIAGRIDEFKAQHFELVYRALGRDGYNASQFGHDFVLSVNGHGVGFSDREELGRDLGQELQNAARAARSFEVEVGDDGKLHLL